MKIDKEKLYKISKKLLMLSNTVKKLDIFDINENYKEIDCFPYPSHYAYDKGTRISFLMETYNLDEFDSEILDILLGNV